MMHLSHSDAPFDAVICLNGNIPQRETFEHLIDRPLVAADGAATVLFRAGIIPEYVVGDFDSISQDVLAALRPISEFVVETDQETNDFEKALVFAKTMLWSRLLVLGLHGGDLEHTLNNWSVMMRFGQDLSIVALDQRRFAIPIYQSFVYAAQVGELVSIIPQPTARLTTTGLHWALTQEDLTLGIREGARNRATDTSVSIHVHSGALLFFCDADLPLAPVLAGGAIFDDSTIVPDGKNDA